MSFLKLEVHKSLIFLCMYVITGFEHLSQLKVTDNLGTRNL